jgi:hypothetical protein
MKKLTYLVLLTLAAFALCGLIGCASPYANQAQAMKATNQRGDISDSDFQARNSAGPGAPGMSGPWSQGPLPLSFRF